MKIAVSPWNGRIAAVVRGRLEPAQRGGAHRDHAPPLGMGAHDAGTQLRAHVDVLGVHVMLLDFGRAHRLEGPGPHVQRQERGFHAGRAQRLDQRRIEMQAGGRRRHRAVAGRVDRLVALAIERGVRPVDVGRQRHVPDGLHHRERRAILGKFQLEHVLVPAQHAHARGLAALVVEQEDLAAGLRRLAGAQLRQHAASAEQPLHQHLHGATGGGLAAEHACRDHARVVEHQQVARTQQARDIGEPQVLRPLARRVEPEQAAARALGAGMPRDQRIGQFVVEIADFHGKPVPARRQGYRRTVAVAIAVAVQGCIAIMPRASLGQSVGTGRRDGFKIRCPRGRAGSSPASGTTPCPFGVGLDRSAQCSQEASENLCNNLRLINFMQN